MGAGIIDEQRVAPGTERVSDARVSTARPRVDRLHRSQVWFPIAVAAALAVGAVTMVEQFEPDPPAVPTDQVVAPRPAVIPDVPAGSTWVSGDAAASLGTEGMTLHLAAGVASISTGPATSGDDARAVSLTTTAIGDLVLGDPVAEQRDREAVNLWPGVTEWYRELDGGFEHGYTIDEAVSGDELSIVVEVEGARPAALDDRSAILTLADDSWLSYRDLHAFDSAGDALPATLAVDGPAISLTIDVADAVYPVTVDPIIAADQQIRGNTAAGEFGGAVAIDGNRMAVGWPGNVTPDAGGPGVPTTGVVLVYERSGPGEVWSSAGYIPNPFFNSSSFGRSIAINGDQIAVGDPRFDLGETADTGVVYIFEPSGPGWTDVATIAPSAVDSYGFGFSLDFVATDRLVIGAPGFVNDTILGAGQVFEYNGGALSEISTGGYVALLGDQLGYAVAVDQRAGVGFRLIAGSPGRDDGGLESGAALIFEDTGTGFGWTNQFGYATGQRFGTAVDVEGDTIVTGSLGDPTAGSMQFNMQRTPDDGTTWDDLFGAVTPDDGGDPGRVNNYLDLEGGTLALGNPNQNRIELYRYDGTAWGPSGPAGADTFVPAGVAAGDELGSAVALDGSALVVGAPGDDGLGDVAPESGAVYAADIPVVATFTGASAVDATAWNDPTNWDVGVVPGTDDTAIVPLGFTVTVIDSRSVGRLQLIGGLQIQGGASLDLIAAAYIGPESGGNGNLTVWPNAVLSAPSEPFVIEGGLYVREIAGELADMQMDAGSTLTGTGGFFNWGVLTQTGTGDSVIDSGLSFVSQPLSTIDVTGGNLAIDALFNPLGEIAIAPGSTVAVANDLALVDTSSLTIRMDASGVHGTLVVGETLTMNGGLALDNPSYVVQPTDVFTIATCSFCAVGAFDSLAVGSLDLVQSYPSLTLQTISNKLRDATQGLTGYGTAVDIVGDVAVVGEPDPGGASGRVQVLGRDPGSGVWSTDQTITGGAGFGSSVAIDDPYIVIVDDTSMYWYEFDGSNYTSPVSTGAGATVGIDMAAGLTLRAVSANQIWIQDHVTPAVVFFDDPAGLSAGAELGASVAFGGDVAGGEGWAAVGVPGDDTVVLYEQNGGTWNPNEIVLTSPSGETGARFGESVAMVGDLLVVGEPGNDDQDIDTGSLWVYQLPDTASPTQILPGFDIDVGSGFGFSVATDGTTIVGGAPEATGFDATVRDGAAVAFEFDGADWVEVIGLDLDQLDEFDGDAFGYAVAVDGENVLVGAPDDDNSNGPDAGAVYSFAAASAPPTFIGASITDATAWNDATNWSTGAVPGPTDTAVIPDGQTARVAPSATIGRVIVDGDIVIDAAGDLVVNGSTDGPSVIGGSGGMVVGDNGATLQLADGVTVDLQGSLTTSFDAFAPGSVMADGEVSIVGDGDVVNSGEVVHTGVGTTLTVGSGIFWSTGSNGVLRASEGTIEILSDSFDFTVGTVAAQAGATVRYSGPTPLGPMTDTSTFQVYIDGPSDDPANYGRIEIDSPSFDLNGVFAAEVTATPDADDIYPVLECIGCTGSFDSVEAAGLQFGVDGTTYTLRAIDNKIISVDPGLVDFGLSVDVDGDWAVIGEPDRTGPFGQLHVLNRDPGTGDWSIVQTFGRGQGFAADVSIDGSYALAASPSDSAVSVYYRADLATPFAYAYDIAIDPTAGLDVADGTFIASNGSVTWVGPLSPTAETHTVITTSGTLDVALGGDVAGGTGWAAAGNIGGSGFGGVAIYDQTGAATWSTTSTQYLESDFGTFTFGETIDADGDHLIVGDPLYRESGPLLHAGAAWIFERTGGVFDDPGRTLLQASDTDVSNQFGYSVAIDGDAVVVGALAGFLTGNPYRDGAAYSFVNDGSGWSETAIFRAVDGADGESFGAAVSVDGDNILIGAPDDFNGNGPDAGAAYWYDLPTTPDVPPELTFDFDLAPGVPDTVAVAPSGIAVNLLDRNAIAARGGGTSNVAASSITAIGAQDTSLASIAIGATPIGSIVLESDYLSAIPLVSIDIDGGWGPIIAGSELENEPLSSVTFGQVFATGSQSDPATPAGRLAAAPLQAIEVDGTSLAAITVSAIALGQTPLKAIPLKAIAGGDDPWCAIIDDLLADGETCAAAVEQLTVMEITLRGVPLKAIPLKAIPLKAIDLDQSPLKAIPLKAIDLDQSPLKAIPLKAIPLKAIELLGSPLKAIPLKAIPLKAIPVSAVDLEQGPLKAIDLDGADLDITTSVRLEATPLKAIDASGQRLSAIEVSGAPLKAIPLTAILLADVPLGEIPVEQAGTIYDWCDVLADANAGYDCDSGVDPATTTLNDLSIRGVPLKAIPLKAIPLKAILQQTSAAVAPLKAIPLKAIPLKAIPLKAIDLDAAPLKAIEVNGAELGQTPLKAIDVTGSPLKAIPLKAITPGSLPLGEIPLKAIPLTSVPLKAIDLESIEVVSASVGAVPLKAIPLKAIDVTGSPLKAIPLKAIPLGSFSVDCSRVNCSTATLGDAVERNALTGDPTLGDIQAATSGIRLGDLVGAIEGLGFDALAGSVLTMADLSGLDDLTLGDIAGLVALDDVTLSELGDGLNEVTLADLVGALLDLTTGAPVPGLEIMLLDALDQIDLTLGDLDGLGDITLGDLLDGLDSSQTITLEDIEPLLRFITVATLEDAFGISIDLGNLALGDLTEEQVGQLTLADLDDLADADGGEITIGELLRDLDIAGQLEGFTLGDLLLALIDPASLAHGGVEFAAVDVAALPDGSVPPTRFAASFSVTADSPKPVSLEIIVPSTASFVSGSGSVSAVAGGVGPPSSSFVDPVVDGRTLRWDITAGQDVAYTVAFDVLPRLNLGTTSLDATARIVGTDVVVPATASVAVAEGLEPNDFPPPEVTPVVEDVIYLTYISQPSDIDVFQIEVAENERLIAQLSNLDADLDIVLWGDPDDVAHGAALGRTSDQSPLVAISDPDANGADAEPLDDFMRLDEIDPGLGVVAASNLDGTRSEYLATDRLPAGTYYVQVYGSNGATNVDPAALQLKLIEPDVRPECVAVGASSAASPGSLPSIPGSANTLILVNQSRMERFYGADARADVDAALAELTGYLEGDPTINPVVVPVDGNASVRDAYAAWDSDASCNPESANAVVAEINAEIIDDVRDQLDHIVILGGDEIVPMARLADSTAIANEYDYRHEFDGDLASGSGDGLNAFTSTFWESRILSDDPYGDADARSLGTRYLYVPDVALGRVVETPDDIVSALETFVGFDGTLDVSTAAVLGYDFLADGSAEVADQIAAGGVAPIDDELADGLDAAGTPWDRGDATTKIVEAGSNALISLNAHFDHYRALPAVGDKVPGFADNLVAAALSDTLGDLALAQSLIFSMGCHSGLSVSDVTIGRTNADWAQELGGQGALFVGNTGFGYGDTEAVAYTEQLMALFAEQATAPLDLDPGQADASSTIGQALTWAKNEYVAGLQTFSVYDEKAVMESTFYGLPFYRVGLPTEEPPAGPVIETVPSSEPGTSSTEISGIDAQNVRVPTPSGTYYTNVDDDGVEQVIVAPGRPIQPKLVEEITVSDEANPRSLGEVAHGAIVLDMESTTVRLPDPVIATPIFDESIGQPEPHVGQLAFPSKPVSITTSTGPLGQRQQLALATGRYRPDGGIQRLDDDLDVVVYYATPGETDFSKPTITSVTSSISAGQLSIEVTASDGPNGEVDRVYVLLTQNPAGPSVEWSGVDLARTGSTNTWTATVPVAPGATGVEMLAQAKDLAGNVGYATTKAPTSIVRATPPPPEDLTVEVDDSNQAESGWYDGPVTVTVSAAEPAVVSIDGGPEQPVDGGSFQITGDGIHAWYVTAGTATTSGTVQIDADGAPRISIGSPGDGASYTAGTGRVDVACDDASLVRCRIRIDGSVVANGSRLPSAPGPHQISVTASDQLGNSTIVGPVTFNVAKLPGAPTIVDVSAPTVPQPISDSVDVVATFVDPTGAADDYTATIDWGDGSESAAAIDAEPTSGTVGRLSGSHDYVAAGVYTVTVTVEDDAGGLDEEMIEFVVVFDPSISGRVSGAGAFWSGPEAYADDGPWGTAAVFGYNARYKSGDDTPSGNTKLRLVGEFLFRSTSYDYLIVNDAMAIAEGVGTTDDDASYRFRVQGIDNGWIDFFQITVWDEVTGDVLYDNGVLYDEGDLVILGGIRVKP